MKITTQQGLIFGGLAGFAIAWFTHMPKILFTLGGAAAGAYLAYKQDPNIPIIPLS